MLIYYLALSTHLHTCDIPVIWVYEIHKWKITQPLTSNTLISIISNQTIISLYLYQKTHMAKRIMNYISYISRGPDCTTVFKRKIQ